MDVLHQTLNRAIASLPPLMLAKVIAKKLSAQGVKFPKTLPAKLAAHMSSGSEEPFSYRSRTLSRDITLSIDEADGVEMTRVVDRFLKVQLPALISDLGERLARKTLRDLKRKWPEEQRLQQKDLSEFRGRMENTWGTPLGKLRMLLTIAREWCGEAHQERSEAGSSDKSWSKKLMVRFLVRACQVTDEIICLLENGFADGAMARWRTLHEIGVVAAVLSKYGEEIADRYVAHQAVESRRALDKYLACYRELGYRPIGARRRSRIEKRYRAAIAQYGKTFKLDYGWAAHHLGKDRPTFADLEAKAGFARMRAYYQMGNDNVHAGVKSMYVRLGLLPDYDSLLAGRSNAGLTDPAQNAAHTLTQIAVLVCLSPRLDDVVAANIVQMLKDEIPRSFSVADDRLRRKHKAFVEAG